jgi:hypothetical protein
MLRVTEKIGFEIACRVRGKVICFPLPIIIAKISVSRLWKNGF